MNFKIGFLSLLTCLIFVGQQSIAQDENECLEVPSNKKTERKMNDATKLASTKGQYEKAKEILIGLIVDEPNYGNLYFTLGEMAYEFKDDKTAIQYLKQTTAICPTQFPKSHYFLGKIYEGRLEDELAMEEYEAFLKNTDGNAQHESYAEQKVRKNRVRNLLMKNPVDFKPELINETSTDGDEYLAVISPDEDFLFFTRRFIKKTKDQVMPQLTEEFSLANRAGSDFKYTKGDKMPPPFNSNQNEGGPSVSIDNKELYFTVCIPTGNGKANCDIFYSRFDEHKNEWTELKNLGTPINRPDTWESQPCMSSDGKTLYFSSIRPESIGGADIFKSNRNDDGSWSVPENLGPTINTSGNEKSPFMHSDSQTLYYASDSLPGLGGYDIFYTKHNGSGWDTPVNIGYPINTEASELALYVNTQGDRAYFASNNLKGIGGYDLYSFNLYAKARPSAITIVKGHVKTPLNDIDDNTIVEMKNLKTNTITKVKVEEGTGKYTAAIRSTDEYLLTVKKPNYQYTSTLIKPADLVGKPKLELQADEIKEIRKNEPFIIKNIQFTTNSFVLNNDSRLVLTGLIDFLNDNKEIRISVDGHTDNVNDDNSNLVLSQERAHEVMDFLISKGIDKNRLEFHGYGETKPIADNSTEEGRAQNRRTEFIILE